MIDRSAYEYQGRPLSFLNYDSGSYNIPEQMIDIEASTEIEKDLVARLAALDIRRKQDAAANASAPWKSRWTPLRPHTTQRQACLTNARFVVIPAGRRSGKTELIGKRKMIMRFLNCRFPNSPFYSPYPDPRYFIGAPTRDQAKRIYWDDLKAMVPRDFLAKPPNESHLMLQGKNGAVLYLMGLDKPERVEGSPWDHCVIDEIGNVKPGAWEANIRPALSDRNGGADFIGVPEGRNHYWELWLKAKEIMREKGIDSDWAAYHWISADILTPEEIEAAKADLDPLTYQQEYEASFVNFTGMAYYNFQERYHVGNFRQYYNPKRPISFCFDFNVEPGVAVIVQEMGADTFNIPVGETVTVAIGEVHIPVQSNTRMVCEKLIKDWYNHTGNIICYGDSTGGSKGSAKVRGSDWDIIKDNLTPAFGDRLYFNVPKSNPRERVRVNAVNSRLMSATGKVRFLMDGQYCPKLIRDFEGVRVIDGSAGEIDKKSDPKLTHSSDAVGYYVHYEYPVFKYYTAEDIRESMRYLERKKQAIRGYQGDD